MVSNPLVKLSCILPYLNVKLRLSTIILATNLLWDIGNFGINTTPDSVTWDGWSYDVELCMKIPGAGYYRRDHEQAVSPHAIGCQAPTRLDEYITILKGQHGSEIIIFNRTVKYSEKMCIHFYFDCHHVTKNNMVTQNR